MSFIIEAIKVPMIPVPKERIVGSASHPRASSGSTILVVDDQPIIRNVIAEELRDNAFVVLEAEDGKSGLDLIRHRNDIDLALIDVGLPDMDGYELARQARDACPSLPISFITGFGAQEHVSISGADCTTLLKPFTLDTLMSHVRAVTSHGMEPASHL
jgi:DNA-binding response OmpR family regulator